MKKLKLVRVKNKAADGSTNSAKPAKSAADEESDKTKRKRKPKSRTPYVVRVYGQGITKWGDKHKTKIIECRDGLLFFEHRRPYSKKMATVVVPVERVLQFGSAGEVAWVHLKPNRILIDEFTAREVNREGALLSFVLSDDTITQVNVDADIEIVKRDD